MAITHKCPCCNGGCPSHPDPRFAPFVCLYGGPFEGFIRSENYYGDLVELEKRQASKYGVGRPENYRTKAGATTVKEVQDWARDQ